MSDLVSVMLTPPTVEWDLPEGVLCQILDLLPIKLLGRCCSVKKSWSDLISENHDLKLERAWRTGEITPERSHFDMPDHDICQSAKHGDTIAVGVLSHSMVRGIAIMDLRNDGTFFRNDIDWNGVLRFTDGLLLSGDQESGVVRVWDVPEVTEKASFKIPQGVVDVADVGEHVAVCGSYGYLGFWKKEDWSESQVLQIRKERITSFTYFRGLFYCGLIGGKISVWSLENSSCIAELETHGNFVETLVVKERVIASCSLDKIIDISSGGSHLRVMGRECGKVLQDFHYEGFSQSFEIGHSKFACQLSIDKIELWDIDEDYCFRTIDLGRYIILDHNFSVVIGTYLTVDKLTVVVSEGEVLQFDFASFEN